MTSKSAQLTAIVIAHSVQAIAEAGGVSGTKNSFPLNHTLFTPSTYHIRCGFTLAPAPVFNTHLVFKIIFIILAPPVNPAEPKINQKTLKSKLNFSYFNGTNPRGWLRKSEKFFELYG